jgi:lipopolysaccharide/colanic/teichoic acid biosynthesis glycosyltransferase
MRSPASRAHLRLRYLPTDLAIAAASPYLALYLRNAMVLSTNKTITVMYSAVSFVCSLLAFLFFKIEDSLPKYFSVMDLLNLVKAVMVAEFMTGIVLFTASRLDGVPRSVPAIHALVLGAGLVAARGLACFLDQSHNLRNRPAKPPLEHLILIGLNDLSVFLMKFLEASTPRRHQVIALLDPKTRLVGRCVQGVRIFGPPSHLDSLIEEFAIHGICISRVLVSSGPGTLSPRELQEVRGVCARRGLDLSSVKDLIVRQLAGEIGKESSAGEASVVRYQSWPHVSASSYFRWKGRIEFLIALGLLLALWPLWLFAVVVAFLDVGSPTLFWQQRVGVHGRHIQLYKVRTLRPAFDRYGRRRPDELRLSWVGGLLRRTRLDELPQLLNVLSGNMSLVGPRPLLPRDQPSNPSVRLIVRPGITGWAQVNGGNLLTPEEKDALDAWYIRHASFWLDVRIVAMTVHSLVYGDQRPDQALATAREEREAALPEHDRSAQPGFRPGAEVVHHGI